MENKTLLIVVALLLAGLVIIYFARNVNTSDINSGTNMLEHSDLEK